MGCGCNKTPSGAWVYEDSEGTEHDYPSEVEAKAAKIRAGGAGSVRPA